MSGSNSVSWLQIEKLKDNDSTAGKNENSGKLFSSYFFIKKKKKIENLKNIYKQKEILVLNTIFANPLT